MAKKLTRLDYECRAYALEEAADHLTLDWTDNAEDLKAGFVIAKRLTRMAQIEYAKAEKIGAKP